MDAEKIISVDVRTPLTQDPRSGHNRWHHEVPPLSEVNPGEVLQVDLRDGIDGQIRPDSTIEDIANFDWDRGHPMTGPLFVNGAKAGDMLDVEILDIEPDNFGSTMVVPGFGPLGDRFSDPYLVRWSIEGGVARSEDLRGVAIPGRPFLGVMGVVPSIARMSLFNDREASLAEGGHFILPPEPSSAVPSVGPPATEGLRTIPPRETGGNVDIKQLTVGSRLRLPVDVDGALFSVGDPHFAQGDGECCGFGIEMSATAQLRFSVQKTEDQQWSQRFPSFTFREPAEPNNREYFATTGLPIDDNGDNKYLDLNVSTRVALEEMLRYLVDERGFGASQAYALMSVAVDLRISEMVDVPNTIVSAILPLDIFVDEGR